MSEEQWKSPVSEAVRPSAPSPQKRTGWAELASGEAVELADLRQRSRARLVDMIFFVVPVLVFPIVILIALPLNRDALFYTTLLTICVVFVGYEGVQVAVWGQTVGRRIAGIKVISAANGGAPGWVRSLLRSAISIVPPFFGVATGRVIGTMFGGSLRDLSFPSFALYAFLGALFGVILLHQRKRCHQDDSYRYLVGKYRPWHDRVAGTLVVKQ